ncbi:MAG: MFS transporter [Candidatus Odinarchaeota archaeon]
MTFLSFTVLSGYSMFFTYFLLDENRGLNYNTILAGIIIACYFITWLLFAPQAGSISDKYGWKRFLMLGYFLSGICFLLLPLWNNFFFFCFLNVINGLGAALRAGTLVALLTQFTPEENYGTAMGTYYSVQGFGTIAGLITGSLTWDILGIIGSPIFTVISWFSVIVILLSGSSEGREFDRRSMREISEIRSISNPFTPIIDSWKQEVIRKYTIAWLAFSMLVSGGGQYMPVIITNLSGGVITATGVLVLLVPAVVLIALTQPVVGYLADRFGRSLFQFLGIIGAMSLVTLVGGLAFSDMIAESGSSSQIMVFVTGMLSFSPLLVFGVISMPTILFTLSLALAAVLATCFIPSSLGILVSGINKEEKAQSLGLLNALVGTGNVGGIFIGSIFLAVFGYGGVILFCFFLTLMLWSVKIG